MMLLRTLMIAAIVAMPMAPAHSADFISQLFKGGEGGCDKGFPGFGAKRQVVIQETLPFQGDRKSLGGGA